MELEMEEVLELEVELLEVEGVPELEVELLEGEDVLELDPEPLDEAELLLVGAAGFDTVLDPLPISTATFHH